MDEGLSPRSFGLLIAYCIPGYVALLGLGFVSEPIDTWLRGTNDTGPTVGGFLYVVLSSLAAGLLASTVRWLLLDTLHHMTGVSQPHLDYSQLSSHVGAVDYLTEQHYRYYQFYGNALVATLFSYVLWRSSTTATLGSKDFCVFLVEALLLIGSRDTLRRFYLKTSTVLQAKELS